jgi:hypothetical protein
MREGQAEVASFSGQLQKSKRLYAQAVELLLEGRRRRPSDSDRSQEGILEAELNWGEVAFRRFDWAVGRI